MTTTDARALLSDPALAAAAQEGDEGAFALLYDRHAPTAWRLALAVTGDPDEAAAVLSETFARVFTAVRLGRFSPDTTFRTLVLTTVRHAAVDRTQASTATGATARFAYASAPDAALIGAAFAPLPERWRAVLWLSDVEGVRTAKIAPVVSLATDATAGLRVRAREGLRERYLQAHVAQTGGRNCSRAVARLGVYTAGKLGAADTDKLERHLRLCEPCSARRDELADLAPRLRLLVLPLPAGLIDEARTAWTAAVVTPGTRTGLSPTTEKLLAGVSAFAAAAGVLGATLFGASVARNDHRPGATASPSSAEIAQAPVELDTPVLVELPTRSRTSFDEGFGSRARRSTAGGTGSGGSGDDTVVGANNSGGQPTPATNIGGGTGPGGSTPSKPGGGGGGGEKPPFVPSEGPTPPVAVGTNMAGLPIAVEISELPGITVGPLSVGSKPTPGESTIAVGGPLAPLAPAVQPVDNALGAVGL